MPHPEYGHFAMINGSDGAPLSKRNGSEAVRELRAQGYHPLAVANYLARLGHYYANNAYMTLEQLATEFSLEHISTSPARHDIAHLRHWQKEAILHSNIEEILELIKPYVQDHIPADKQAEFAALARENILMPSDVQLWVDAVSSSAVHMSDAEVELLARTGRAFFEAAAEYVNSCQANVAFKPLADYVKDKTGCKGKELFMPLRIALTGQNHGPELAKLIEFMPKALILHRFENAASKAK